MQKAVTSYQISPKKNAFKKKVKKQTPKVKVEKFAKAFYAEYGQMMSRLSHE